MTTENCYLVYALCEGAKINLRVFTDLDRANAYIAYRKIQSDEIPMKIETLDFSFGSERGENYQGVWTMKTLYTVYRNEILMGIASSEDDAWYIVYFDQENRKHDKTFSMSDEYRVEKIYTNLECGL